MVTHFIVIIHSVNILYFKAYTKIGTGYESTFFLVLYAYIHTFKFYTKNLKLYIIKTYKREKKLQKYLV